MEGGRLKQIPGRRKKRLVILRWLADHFRPAERYTEAQVNDILLRYHDDPAYLRRLMVDEELMHRYGGLYWRAGKLPPPRWPAGGCPRQPVRPDPPRSRDGHLARAAARLPPDRAARRLHASPGRR